MSLISLSEAQSRVGATVTQDHIDEAEEWLAARIGPLRGERSETFFYSQRRKRPLRADGLWLRRRTDTVAVTNDGEALASGTDYRLIDGLLIERIPDSAFWGDTIVATYEPTDEETVRSVLFDLLGLRQQPSNIQSVRIGQYSETYFPASGSPVERALLERVLPGMGMGIFDDPFRYAAYRRDRTLVTPGGGS